MDKKPITSVQFVNLVAQVAARHGCVLKGVDLEAHNIDLYCPTDDQTRECALELDRLFAQYTC